VEIYGIDPASYSKVTNFGESLHFKKGARDVFSPPYSSNSPGCVLGIDMRYPRTPEGGYDLPATLPGEAYTISCIPLTAKGALAKAGTTSISSKTFYLTDISHRGLVTPDGKFAYIPLKDAQLLCGMAGSVKRASSLHIKFTKSAKLEENTRKVSALWDDFVNAKSSGSYNNLLVQVNVKSWKSYRRESISAMEKEQVMMTILFGLVGLTAVFIVFVVFYMLVNHKRKDLGILKSLGAGNSDIAAMLSVFASLIAVIGSVAGTAGAWLFLSRINVIEQWLFETFGFQLWNRSIYAIGKIPSDLPFSLALTVTVCAILACMLGGSIPIYKAARSEPIQTLQVGE
jgi:ABC-type lipoprotein release transport system permease subunit